MRSSQCRKYFRFSILISAALLSAVGARSEILTSFWRTALSDQNQEGWRFAWNPNGPMEEVAKYDDLAIVKSQPADGRRQLQRGMLDGAGALRADAPTLSTNGAVEVPRGLPGESKRYLIASYTMPRDSHGVIWLNDGNFQNKNVPTGVELKLFLNGVLRKSLTADMNPMPTLFQETFGPLKKGDTISVAVGPVITGQRAGGLLRYTIEEWRNGQSPPPPQNTLQLPIDSAGPQFDPDGSSATYEAQQAALNETLLARQPELVFIGDSITARWPQELLEENFGAYHPVKLAIGGDWVQNVAWRLERTSLEAVPLKVAVFLIGTNNLGKFPPNEIAKGIEKLVKKMETKAPEAKILLLGVLPRGPALQDPKNESVFHLNAKIQALADNKRVFYLDVGPSLAESDGTIPLEVTPDRLHVAMPGFLRWMKAMKPTLESLLLKRLPESSPDR